MAYFLIFAAAALRVLPHAANFAPISAMALFGGTYLNKKLAFVMPIAAMIVSDYFIGFDSFISRATVYGSFILIGFIGMWLRHHKNLGNVLGATLFASVLFYLITNFAYFYSPAMYPHNWQGIIASYINALPFFRNTVLGDLFYVSLLFGIYELVSHWSREKVIPQGTNNN